MRFRHLWPQDRTRSRSHTLLTLIGFCAVIAGGLFMLILFQGMFANYRNYSDSLYDGYIGQLNKTTLSDMSAYIEKHYPILWDIERLKKNAGSDQFWQTAKEWRDIADTFNFKYIYYIEKKDDNYSFLMSATLWKGGNNDWFNKPVWEGRPPAFIDEAWQSRELTFSPEPVVNEWGKLVSLVRPIMVDERVVGILGIDYDTSHTDSLKQHESLLHEQERGLMRRIALISALVCLIVIVVLFYSYRLSNTSVLIPRWEKESYERTRAMLNSAPMMVNIWDTNLRLLECNHESINLLGLSNEQEYIDNFFKLSPEYQPCGRLSSEMALDSIKKAFEGGALRFEWMHQKLNGEQVPCEMFLTRVKVANGFVVVAYAKDLREIKTALIKEREAEEAKNTIYLLEKVLDEIDAMIFATVAETGEILLVNKKLKEFYGLEGDCVGKLCYKVLEGMDDKCDFCPCHQLDKEPDKSYVWIKENSKSGRICRNTDIYIEWPGVKTAHLQCSFDITELNEAKEQAIRADNAKSKFLATMSHEVRTPMNAILGLAGIHMQNEKLSPELQSALGTIHQSGKMLLGIVNDLLDLSKIEAGKMDLLIEAYDVPSLISDTVQLNVMRIGSKPIKFELFVDEKAPASLYGDALRIRQILNNLLSNAIKYTESGTVMLDAAFDPGETGESGPMLVFKVADSGQGMTPEQVAKLFNEYTRFNLEANRGTEGTGLGLSITSKLIKLMDGQIYVESEAGKGSVFTVRLPQKTAGPEEIGKEMAENLQRLNFKNGSQINDTQILYEPMPYGKVLVVDDMEINLYVAKGMLSPYDLKIETAISGVEAIERVKCKEVFDIIFMDHMMPNMDGMEAVNVIRRLGYAGSIIALTANALMGQAEVFLANGFDGYLSKPIDIRQLDASLHRLIVAKKPPEVVEAARKAKEKQNAAIGTQQPAPKPPKSALKPGMADIFTKDAEKILGAMEVTYGFQFRRDGDIRLFTVHSHAMKSALAYIEEMELSEDAKMLEQAGRERDIDFLLENTPPFLNALRDIIEKHRQEDASVEKDEAPELLREKLSAILAASSEYDSDAIRGALQDLGGKKWRSETNALLSTISDHLLRSEYEEIEAAAKKALE